MQDITFLYLFLQLMNSSLALRGFLLVTGNILFDYLEYFLETGNIILIFNLRIPF